LLRGLPSVDTLLGTSALKAAIKCHSKALVTEVVRGYLESVREAVSSGDISAPGTGDIAGDVLERIEELLAPGLKPVINATGTILHTNLGRAELAEVAKEAVRSAAGSVNVEYDLAEGKRGSRDSRVEVLVTRLTGAEAACVVNNNAAAVLITLNTLAEGREVVISRGELIEIGGSFRLPDIIEKSGCVLKEVGTTNKAHASDYEEAVRAISPVTNSTAVVLKAHTSNFRVVGFTSGVALTELADIAHAKGAVLVEDLGSGALVDIAAITGIAELKEPVVADSISGGADVVTFSGDKLLGGPQAGIIAGRRTLIDRIRRNPLKRALRVDKLTLAALEATLILYLNTETLAKKLPTLAFLTRPVGDIEKGAKEAAKLLKAKLGKGYKVEVVDSVSEVGSGTLPTVEILSKSVSIKNPGVKCEAVAKRFLASNPPIVGRIKDGAFLLDMRLVEEPTLVVPK
jgi:L-seryl-tRNA(Ser) seleniumtransferase